ncbi:hypothetical protein GOA59_18920 [Sinorhizobium meliloti]|uniref:heparinase II/III domain-containing protein n=1 Tax=Rhizobium meliloti TaxID=382 RepID=UPI000FD22287|nr:heparinase II/III family protein [Sinorhizobium meliloti]MDW9394369.1 hypothetical protein [Sinorhizobium meliloti]MDW9434543.1 hypothetical protein [Sinorhizobium meliloti]MDW9487193.1 hypothetical protein [Sinorhizobium meliloti]MDW9605864.1 hypothetical protein [Sinorhizobium meliloti]MDW9674874.1 hypothetical protein [Sinorhizobium meliloti]
MFNWKYPNRRAELAVLRSGKIPMPPSFKLPDLDYTNGVDWTVMNDEPPSVRWFLNHLLYTRPLLLASTDDDIAKATMIIKSWIDANSVEPQSDFAWDGHATAFRSEQIACLKTHISEEWLDRSIIQHAEFLANPANYQGDWNHGLDQNIGLLSLGHVFNNREWIELARERAIAAISKMVDWQGVSIEQAVAYHFYNYIRFQDAEAMFAECDAALPSDIFRNVHNMTTFLAHATLPNGKWCLIGDTINHETDRDRLRDTDAGFALSQGAHGARPNNLYAVYQSGYVFGRSGWGDARPFDEESHYSLRFGPGRVIHGHNDHTSLTYYTKKDNLIIDGGFHGYTNDKFRDHLRTPAAHNVVYTTDKAKFHWNAKTVLKEFRIQIDWQSYVLADEPYPKSKRSRSVLFVQRPIEFVLVLDRVVGPKRRYEQAWHFDDKVTLEISGNRVEASAPNTSISIHQLWPVDSLEVVKGRQEPPQGWGGFGSFDLRPIPTLVSARSGSDVTFLTAMVVQPSGAQHKVEIIQRPIKVDGVSRHISIRVGSASVNVALMEDGMLLIQ